MEGPETPQSRAPLPVLDIPSLGPPDCTFLGADWSLPAHK